jgi:hypothetical protein
MQRLSVLASISLLNAFDCLCPVLSDGQTLNLRVEKVHAMHDILLLVDSLTVHLYGFWSERCRTM